MAKFGCNVNRIRIQRDVYFTPWKNSRKMQQKKFLDLMKLLQNQK